MTMPQKDLGTFPEANDEYRELLERHRGYEMRLEELARKHHLSPEEEYEEHEIKKKKLLVKDRLELLRRKPKLHAATT